MNSIQVLLESYFQQQDNLKALIDILSTLSLSVIGIAFTLFTVLQSFIENRKSSVDSHQKVITERSDPESTLTYHRQQVKFGCEYINRQKRLVKKLVSLILFSCVLYLASLILPLIQIQRWTEGLAVAILLVGYLFLLAYLVIAYINIYCHNIYAKPLKSLVVAKLYNWIKRIKNKIWTFLSGIINRVCQGTKKTGSTTTKP